MRRRGDGLRCCLRAGVWRCAGWVAAGGGLMVLTDSCETGATIAGVMEVGAGSEGVKPQPLHPTINGGESSPLFVGVVIRRSPLHR